MQSTKKRSAPGKGAGPNKRARLEAVDAFGLGSQNPDGEDEEQEAERQQKANGPKDTKLAFKVMVIAGWLFVIICMHGQQSGAVVLA